MTTTPPAPDELRIRHYLRDLGVSHHPVEDDWWTALYGPDPDERELAPVEPQPRTSRLRAVRDRIIAWGERPRPDTKQDAYQAPDQDAYPHDKDGQEPGEEAPPSPTGPRPRAAWRPATVLTAPNPRLRWAVSLGTCALVGWGLRLQHAFTWCLADTGDSTAAMLVGLGLVAAGGYLAHRTRHWWAPLAWACRIPFASALLALALYAPGATP